MTPFLTHRTVAATLAAVLLPTLFLPSSAQVTEPEMRELESRLPPAATTQADFNRDIRPIFENACIQCHGSERPKADYSLISRDAALKAGDNGPNIVPGQSARSPL